MSERPGRALPWAEAAVLLVTAAWGYSFVVLKSALADAGPWSLTAVRMAVGFGSTMLLLRPALLSATAVEWRGGVAGGLLLAGGYVLQTAGLTTAGAGAGGFITALYVALVPFVDAAVFRRVPALRDALLLAVCCGGIGLIALDPDTLTLSFGETLIAISAICWAAQIVVVGRVAERSRATTLTAIQLLVLVVVTGAGALAAGEPPIRWTWNFVASVFFLGHVTCALAFATQAWAQRRFPPTRTAILFSPEPVFAALFGIYFRGEAFGAREVAGGALVLAAVAFTVLRPPAPSSPDAAASHRLPA